MEDYNGFIDFEHMVDGVEEEKSNSMLSQGNPEEEMLMEAVIKNNAKATAESLYKSAQNEEEKLLLREKVAYGSYPDDIKGRVLDILDEYVKEELKQEIVLAASIEKIKKEHSDLKLGAIAMVVIGFVVSVFFPLAWIIGIILAVIGYKSSKKESEAKMQNAMSAFEKVEKYKSAGYRI